MSDYPLASRLMPTKNGLKKITHPRHSKFEAPPKTGPNLSGLFELHSRMQNEKSAYPDACEFIRSLNSNHDMSFDVTWDPGSAESLFRPSNRVQIDINGVSRDFRLMGSRNLPDGTVDVELELIEDAPSV